MMTIRAMRKKNDVIHTNRSPMLLPYLTTSSLALALWLDVSFRVASGLKRMLTLEHLPEAGPCAYYAH
uniref:Uncharacterized protein n=1 Tax=Rhizophora mucronata TaxID=61149 RepID=A0A2P2KTF7_RHIMU